MENRLCTNETRFKEHHNKYLNFSTGTKHECQYKTHTDTRISCTMPPLGHFTGYIQIVVPGIGASNKTAEESRIVSVLQMTGVSPDTGSRFGNTQINISGFNFGVDRTKVYFLLFSNYCFLRLKFSLVWKINSEKIFQKDIP